MTTTSSNSTDRRRWVRLSLRSFFVLLSIICVWLGTVVQSATQQRKAVEWITEKSGRAWYDFQIDNPRGMPVDLDAEPPGPNWLRERVGVDYFANLRWVEVSGADDLTPIASLCDVQRLHIDHSSVTDITPLKKLTTLRMLYLRHSPISDIRPLSELTNLHHLSLNDTDVQDVTPLFKLKSLRSLNLHRTRVTEHELSALKRALPNCGVVWSPRE